MELNNIYILFLMGIIQVGCVEEYSPNIDDYIDIPVVEGIITNDPGPYTIKLTKTSKVYHSSYEHKYIPLENAKLTISDDLNQEEILTEYEPGVYKTDPTGIRAEIGRKYKLTVEIDGETYQSNYEELYEAYEIDSLYSAIEYHQTVEGDFEGLQFYIDTHSTIGKDCYFLWTAVETYEYRPDVVLEYVYKDTLFRRFLPEEYPPFCWKTEPIYDIYTYSTKNLQSPNIQYFPLNFTGTETRKLYEKYSLYVTQHSISEDAYKYWTELKKQNVESGSLYTKQPYQVKGNMVNINDEDDFILGYFMASGISHKRIFVGRPLLRFYYNICVPNVNALNILLISPAPSFPAYIAVDSDGHGLVEPICFDCLTKGGTDIQPDFWEN